MPSRPSGIPARIAPSAAAVGHRFAAAPSEWNGPGAIAFTRRPKRAHSAASVFVSASTPALALAECATPGMPVQA